MHGDEPGTDLDKVDGEPVRQQGQQGCGDQEQCKMWKELVPLYAHPSGSSHQAAPGMRKNQYSPGTYTQRDGHIQSLAEKGRLGWQRDTDYGRRSMAETAMSRYKRILGDHLHARKLPGQQSEAAIGVAVLNRMINAGCPDSVRIA